MTFVNKKKQVPNIHTVTQVLPPTAEPEEAGRHQVLAHRQEPDDAAHAEAHAPPGAHEHQGHAADGGEGRRRVPQAALRLPQQVQALARVRAC